MYICICKGITDKDIRNAAIGSNNSSEILRKLGVASDCGSCLEDAIKVYTESNNNAPIVSKNKPVNSK